MSVIATQNAIGIIVDYIKNNISDLTSNYLIGNSILKDVKYLKENYHRIVNSPNGYDNPSVKRLGIKACGSLKNYYLMIYTEEVNYYNNIL